MSPELLALVVAVAAAAVRELMAWRDRRDRKAGQKRTRSGDW